MTPQPHTPPAARRPFALMAGIAALAAFAVLAGPAQARDRYPSSARYVDHDGISRTAAAPLRKTMPGAAGQTIAIMALPTVRQIPVVEAAPRLLPPAPARFQRRTIAVPAPAAPAPAVSAPSFSPTQGSGA